MVFQEHLLLPWATVADNLRLALRRHGLARAELNRRIEAVLELVGLRGCAALLPAQLSGGMAQRVALARALVRAPDLLLMDEPLGSLDTLTRRDMQDEIARLRAELPRTTVFVTHDIAEAVRLADRVSVLADGRIFRSFDVHGAPAGVIEALVLAALPRNPPGLCHGPTRGRALP
jgi:ABC-type nitrate/sulfonate/bicarbonate transport system ATPase subunit